MLCRTLCEITNFLRYKINLGKSSSWHDLRSVHKAAFQALSQFIVEEILQKQKIMYLVSLLNRYKSLLFKFGGDELREEDIENYRADYLHKKILREFGESIMIDTSEASHKRRIVYKVDIDVNKLVNDSVGSDDACEDSSFEDIAFAIRNEILKMKTKKLPEKLKVKDVIEGECNIPKKMLHFVSCLVEGPDTRRHGSNDSKIKIESVCYDLIHTVTKGKVKPSKHLIMGIAMKS